MCSCHFRFVCADRLALMAFRKSTRFFREIQLMTAMYRDIYSGYALGSFAAGIAITQILLLFESIYAWKMDMFMKYLPFMLGIVQGVVLLVTSTVFLYDNLAFVYVKATQASSKIQCVVLPQLKRSEWFVKFHRSCPILKIHFGGSNFVDKQFILTLENQVVIQTISLLLLK